MKLNWIFFTLVGILLNEQISASPLLPRQENLGTWKTVGDSGVNAMHAVLIHPRKVVFVDKLEQNHLKRPDGFAALSSEYNLDTNQVRPLGIYTNTFCSTGSFLGNGTLIEAGGDKGDLNYRSGIQTIRVFDQGVGDWIELENVMPSNRWYPAAVTLPNGNVFILGGAKAATGIDRADINNPTYTIYPPPTGTVVDVPFPFLTDTLPYNLYPMVHVMPTNDGSTHLFIFANQNSLAYDLDNAKVLGNYPQMPGGIRTYPLTGTSVMLPLDPANNYNPVIMICGGNKLYETTSPAEASCGRLSLYDAAPAWEMDNFGGVGRVMPDATFLVDGSVLYVNGAGQGFAGYRKGGGANALWVNENPVLAPSLYNIYDKTFKTLAPSGISRMYHSVSTLIPDGTVLIAGSNPQGGVTLNVKYPTEYRVEIFSPPYLFTGIPRPTIVSLNGKAINNDEKVGVNYNTEITLTVKIPAGGAAPNLRAAIIHHGFITHSQNFSQRYVFLKVSRFEFDTSAADQYTVVLQLPPNPTIIAPGPSYVYVFNQNSPCTSGIPVLLTVAA